MRAIFESEFFSRGLRQWAGIEDNDKTDEKVSNEDLGGEAMVDLDPELYGWVHRLYTEPDLLTATELAGTQGALLACWDLGIPAELRPGEQDGPPMLALDIRLTGRTATRQIPMNDNIERKHYGEACIKRQ